MTDRIENYINSHSKSQIAGFLLTLFLGPLGLFYSSWVAALILCVIAFTTAISIIGPVLCWIVAIVISFFSVSKHNEKVRTTAELIHGE